VRLATEAINSTISKVQGCNGIARRSEGTAGPQQG